MWLLLFIVPGYLQATLRPLSGHLQYTGHRERIPKASIKLRASIGKASGKGRTGHYNSHKISTLKRGVAPIAPCGGLHGELSLPFIEFAGLECNHSAFKDRLKNGPGQARVINLKIKHYVKFKNKQPCNRL
jgi:hypothetical protein